MLCGGFRRRAVVLACVVALTGTTSAAYAAYVASTVNPTENFSTAPDFAPPTLNRSTAAGTAAGGESQHITPGASYYMYADLTDVGAPASGMATVTANASALTTGQSSAALTSGAYSFAGVNYNYRSALLTADSNATLSACSYTPTVTGTDLAGNAATNNASKVMVDRNMLAGYNVRLDGATAADQAYDVGNAGDVNGDGTPDAILGGWGADNNGRSFSGSAYVVFGQTSLTTIDMAALGTHGFRIDGLAANDETAVSVGPAGDVNGDGKADLLVGADFSDPNGFQSGTAYVVFGKATTTAIDLNALGAQGYAIRGAAADDRAGERIATIPDLNGDGKPETVLSAWKADNNSRTDSGSVYVVFGKATTTAINVSALGAAGYRIDGAAGSDFVEAVAVIGDVNGDGKSEVVLGATGAGNNGRAASGSAYVVFGKSTTTTVDLASLGAQGYRIDGAAANDVAAVSVDSIGDVNGDGKPEVVLGAYQAGNNGRAASGSAYVVFGKSTTTTVDLASLGAQGYRIDGALAGEQVAISVAGVSDLNSDGIPDLLVGNHRADSNGLTDSGSVYVIFGKSTTTTIDLASFGVQGYRIDGAAAADLLGWRVRAAGDVNADGRTDLITVAKDAGNNGRATSGSAYILFSPTCT
ncbi:MAG: hypothetical protein DLM59_19805 [Pseudonocardiales bacterium]|nr:MAG: hypothetical protein DLM59_19805 [Pseudonocardiales bacterium]